jgi:GNAT superfamily N-acetyltransferase
MAMLFADLALSRRLERAEGYACAQFAAARRRLFPESGAEFIEHAGAYAAFDGVDSPVTQTFGLGIFEELSSAALDAIEKFFRAHGSPVCHEVSPFAGPGAFSLLCQRNYKPIEISNVLFRSIERSTPQANSQIKVRVIEPADTQLWSEVSARGWAPEHPELHDFLLQIGTISTHRKDSPCFLAEFEGQPGAAGALCIHEGVALFGGAATIPELRRRGLQTALLHERMRYAADHRCELAMIVAQPGSDSQRNAERRGFHIAYTRIKWRLFD